MRIMPLTFQIKLLAYAASMLKHHTDTSTRLQHIVFSLKFSFLTGALFLCLTDPFIAPSGLVIYT